MAKTTKAPGRPAGPRGPYKTKAAAHSDVEDPDQLGAGGIRIRQHRLARGWTVAKLAEEAGVSPGTISGIEGGGVGWSKDTLPKLANALGATIGELFDLDPRPGRGNDLWPLWKRAKPNERNRIIDFAKGVLGDGSK